MQFGMCSRNKVIEVAKSIDLYGNFDDLVERVVNDFWYNFCENGVSSRKCLFFKGFAWFGWVKIGDFGVFELPKNLFFVDFWAFYRTRCRTQFW